MLSRTVFPIVWIFLCYPLNLQDHPAAWRSICSALPLCSVWAFMLYQSHFAVQLVIHIDNISGSWQGFWMPMFAGCAISNGGTSSHNHHYAQILTMWPWYNMERWPPHKETGSHCGHQCKHYQLGHKDAAVLKEVATVAEGWSNVAQWYEAVAQHV